MPSPPSLLGVCALALLLLVYLASSEIGRTLSPQGCRMSWMWPSNVLQTEFNSTWSPLTRRYSLWLYREVTLDPVLNSVGRRDSAPVLFIPGNAGSSRQARSIASSAANQFYASPMFPSSEARDRGWKALDFFTAEFNEDLSAFHGSTLEAEIEYSSKAISYILSLYPEGTQITVIGHSMGGIVATSLLPSNDISAIITLSTPHTLPPARFDSRIDARYKQVQRNLREDATPIMSLCGGATDMMIPSESCILPSPAMRNDSLPVFRRTVFSSGLEGAWTGVGHQEMVWCHQVRWRVARAALEMPLAATETARGAVFDTWLRDGHLLPTGIDAEAPQADLHIPTSQKVELLKKGETLALKNPTDPGIYLIPVTTNHFKVSVLVSRGSVLSVSPQNPLPLRVSIYGCTSPSGETRTCRPLPPQTLSLIPHPVPRQSFPVPGEGSDESEGVVLYESSPQEASHIDHIAIKVEGTNGQGWVAASASTQESVTEDFTTLDLLFSERKIELPSHQGLIQEFTLPYVLSNSLLVYRLEGPVNIWESCSNNLFPPLIVHTSHPSETHYFPLLHSPDRRILLHTHLPAPFVEHSPDQEATPRLTIIASPEGKCREALGSLTITVDWRASIGRVGPRYLNTLVSWSIGVVAIVIFIAWGQDDRTSHIPTVSQALTTYTRIMLRYLLPASFFASFAPLPPTLYLGTRGEGVFAVLGPLILLTTSGLVVVMWWILSAILWVVSRLGRLLPKTRATKQSPSTNTILSLGIICAVIFLFVPWQVAYLGSWVLMLHTCASMPQRSNRDRPDMPDSVPLMPVSPQAQRHSPDLDTTKRRQETTIANSNHCRFLLLLMTWLLPIVAPVLVVWVRTLFTAGFTTPFDGDHNFISVLPFLILTDYASWMPGPLFQKPKFESRVSLRWLFAVVAGTAFILGSRRPYLVFDGVRATLLVVVATRIGRNYLTGGQGGSPRP